MLEMRETDKRARALRRSLLCDFTVEVVSKERVTGKAKVGSDLRQ